LLAGVVLVYKHQSRSVSRKNAVSLEAKQTSKQTNKQTNKATTEK